MANNNTPNDSTSGTSLTVITDRYGNEIIRVGYEEYLEINSDGSFTQRRNSDHIQLDDGFMWNPLMLMGKPPRHIGVCDWCRYPPFKLFGTEKPARGIFLYEHGKICVCGQFGCPKHMTYCQDGIWRCHHCLNKHRYAAVLRSIFFKSEES